MLRPSPLLEATSYSCVSDVRGREVVDLVTRAVGWKGLGGTVGHVQMTASHLAVLSKFECFFNSLF